MSCRSLHVAGQEGPTAETRASVPLDNPLLVPTATTAHRFDAFFFPACSDLLYLQMCDWPCWWPYLASPCYLMHT